MVIALARLLGSRQWNRGFTLIELLIVILIVGILAAVATPLYLSYIKDAKVAEAKAIAGALWTAVQSTALSHCDVATPVADAYLRAGLDKDGKTVPPRWSVTPGSDVKVACADGKITPDGDIFTLTGTSDDVSSFKVKLVYDSSATNKPPSRLQCDTDSKTFSDC